MASTFNPDDPKYKCCCGSCEAKQGGFALSVYEVVTGALNLIIALATVGTNSYAGGNVPSALILIVAGTLGIVGIKKNKTVLVFIDYIIHIVYLVLAIIAIILYIIAVIVASSTTYTSGGKDITGEVIGVGVGALVVVLIFFMIEVWLFLVIRGCYHFMRDADAAGATYGVHYGGQATVPAPQPTAYANPPPAYGNPQTAQQPYPK